MKNAYKVLFVLLLTSTSIYAKSRSDVNTNRSGNNRSRVSNLRASSTIRNLDSSTTSSSSTELDKESCEEIFYKCMDEKTNETLMQYDIIYDDYSDMITDIYSGMTMPAFKCIYSPRVKSIYSTYYFNTNVSSPTAGFVDKIGKNSIEYYNYLKENATNVANKTLGVEMLDSDVLSLGSISMKPLKKGSVNLPSVSYKITTLNPTKIFEANVAYCMDSSQNTDLEGCPKLSKKLAEKWEEADLSLNKSCKDYEVFLSEKLIKAKENATSFITGLKTKLESAIEEFNLKIEAEEELKALEEAAKAKEEEEKEKEKANTVVLKKDELNPLVLDIRRSFYERQGKKVIIE